MTIRKPMPTTLAINDQAPRRPTVIPAVRQGGCFSGWGPTL